MANIDHTIIFYKNGKVEEEPNFINCGNYKIFWNRDAKMYKIENTKDNKEIVEFEQCKKEYNIHYEEKMFILKSKIISNLLNKLSLKEKVYEKSIQYFKSDGLEIYNYVEENYNVLYIFTHTDSYVLLGGYGHYSNPYTHFYRRGYGDDFEDKMTKECYTWLCEYVFDDVVRDVYGCFYGDGFLRHYWNKLNFKSYWDMTKEEREECHKIFE